jgi:hypothetical protein
VGLAGGLATNGIAGSGGGGGGGVTTLSNSDGYIGVSASTGAVVLSEGTALSSALALLAPLASPTFTGTVTIPAAAAGTSAAQLAQTHGLQATFGVAGTLATLTGQARYYMASAQTILGTIASVGTAPTGASIIIDVFKNGTTVYTGGTNRPTISASGFVSATTIVAPAVTALAIGDYLTVVISQVGSSIPGSDLTVTVVMS